MIDDVLADLKKKLSYIETQKIQTATKLKLLEEEKDTLLSECTALNVDPAKIEEQIKEEEQALQATLQTFQENIEKHYRELQSFGN